MVLKRVVWFGLVVASVATAGIASVACSDNKNPTGFGAEANDPPASRPDATAKPDETGSTGKDGGSTSKDAGAEACAPYRTFTNDKGAFCPFQADGGAANCEVGQHCCVNSVEAGVPSACMPANTPCALSEDAGTVDYECNEPNDCPSGKKCCYLRANASDPFQEQKCAVQFYEKRGTFRGTSCKDECDLPEERVACSKDDQCPSGKKCYGVRTGGVNLGFCK